MSQSQRPSRTAMSALLHCALLLALCFTTLVAAQPGRACPGSISGRVIFDKNCNGKVDPGEPGLGGVTISLYDAGNNLLKTKVTTSTGYFTFGIMTLNAAYTVQVTVPGGYMATNAIPGKAAQKIDLITLQVNVTLAGHYSGNKFLLCKAPATVNICGTVYNDLNCDHALESGEPPLSNVPVTLYNASNNPVSTLNTDASGNYCFTSEPPGNYTVKVSVPTGFTASNALPGDAATKVDTVTLSVAATNGGTTYNNENFLLCSACSGFSAITSNFNGTNIAAGNTIWFNSVLKVSGLGSQPVTIMVVDATIQFTANGVPYNLSVPNTQITFDPNATTATAAFINSMWVVTTPPNTSGNDFLSGLAFTVPSGGLPGGISPVTWSGYFRTDTPGITLQWQWAAAVYSSFSSDYTTLGVKAVDDNHLPPYQNSDHAGTPESFTQYVIGGARGGGGSNFTGSYSGTDSVAPCPP